MGLNYREVRKVLKEIVGEEAVGVLETCKKKPLTDEEILKKTGLQLNTIRSLLNKLHFAGLVDYNREKNEKTNWFTYTWFVKKDKIPQIIKDYWEEKLKKLEARLDDESSYYYFECVNGCERLPFELAAEYDFKCPECGSEMKHISNKKVIESTVSEIKEIRKNLKKLDAK
ncbi:MAG: transcription initiation factor E subunit alpha [Candidatus Diapherotrites archaeon]|nr:transcription initiation factor E subunit alpha [Candidatus Diapherotrites archaeon]